MSTTATETTTTTTKTYTGGFAFGVEGNVAPDKSGTVQVGFASKEDGYRVAFKMDVDDAEGCVPLAARKVAAVRARQGFFPWLRFRLALAFGKRTVSERPIPNR